VACGTISRVFVSAEADAEADLGEGGRGRELVPKKIENNPMQSSFSVAGMRNPAKTI
jgi:hypothetical protein